MLVNIRIIIVICISFLLLLIFYTRSNHTFYCKSYWHFIYRKLKAFHILRIACISRFDCIELGSWYLRILYLLQGRHIFVRGILSFLGRLQCLSQFNGRRDVFVRFFLKRDRCRDNKNAISYCFSIFKLYTRMSIWKMYTYSQGGK